jgi:sulfoquinovosyltransferase
VWRKGIDTDVFNPAFNVSNEEMRSAMSDGEPHRPLLLYVGRLGTEKNVPLIREVMRRIPEARLCIVGAGPAEPELRQVFEGTDTVFMGLMSGEPLSRAYAAADVFVMPSESETLGFVVLEAMASEVPPVAARAGGIPNLMQDGEHGYLFNPGDADDFTEKVRALISDRSMRGRMGEAGRQEALKWNWRAATSVLRNLQYTRAERNFAERKRQWDNGWWWPQNWLRWATAQPAPSRALPDGGSMSA